MVKRLIFWKLGIGEEIGYYERVILHPKIVFVGKRKELEEEEVLLLFSRSLSLPFSLLERMEKKKEK